MFSMGYIHTAVPDPATRAGMLFAVGVVSVLFVGEAFCELTERIRRCWKYWWEDDEEEDEKIIINYPQETKKSRCYM